MPGKEATKGSSNLEIWNQLSTTPKEVQKTYFRGNKQLTAIDPTYRNKRLTELFGPAGFGWGFWVDEQWSEELCNNQYCFATVTLWRLGNSERQPIATYTGGTRVYAGEADEAYKSAITDALTKCASVLGFGADIYDGSTKIEDRTDAPPTTPYAIAAQCLQEARKTKNDKAFEAYKEAVITSENLTDEEKGELLALIKKQT